MSSPPDSGASSTIGLLSIPRDNLRVDVFSFLHAKEIASLACVSKECNKAARTPEGKLRAVHLLVKFRCVSVDEKIWTDYRAAREYGLVYGDSPLHVTASSTDLRRVASLVDLAGLETLFVVVDPVPSSAQVEVLLFKDDFFKHVVSLMGAGLKTFGLWAKHKIEAYDCSALTSGLAYLLQVDDGMALMTSPPIDDDDDDGAAAEDACAFYVFALALLNLSQLRTLCIPSGMAATSVKCLAKRDRLKKKLLNLERLHLTGTRSPRHVYSAASFIAIALGIGDVDYMASPPHLRHFSCHFYWNSSRPLRHYWNSCKWFLEEERLLVSCSNPRGERAWRKILSPTLRKLSVLKAYAYAPLPGPQTWQSRPIYRDVKPLPPSTASWLARCCGLTHLEIDFLPPANFENSFPALQHLFLTCNTDAADRRAPPLVRPAFSAMMEMVRRKKIALHFSNSIVSAAECGIFGWGEGAVGDGGSGRAALGRSLEEAEKAFGVAVTGSSRCKEICGGKVDPACSSKLFQIFGEDPSRVRMLAQKQTVTVKGEDDDDRESEDDDGESDDDGGESDDDSGESDDDDSESDDDDSESDDDDSESTGEDAMAQRGHG